MPWIKSFKKSSKLSKISEFETSMVIFADKNTHYIKILRPFLIKKSIFNILHLRKVKNLFNWKSEIFWYFVRQHQRRGVLFTFQRGNSLSCNSYCKSKLFLRNTFCFPQLLNSGFQNFPPFNNFAKLTLHKYSTLCIICQACFAKNIIFLI